MRHSLPRALFASTLIALLATQPAWGWGRDGHMLIDKLAVRYLPDSVPLFLRDTRAQETLTALASEPDHWRGKGEPQLSATVAPDHYIDLEWADLVGTPCTPHDPACDNSPLALPLLRYDYVRAVEAAAAAHPDLHLTAEHIGMQPWAVEESWQRLKNEMHDYRRMSADHQATGAIELAILYEASVLSHYVADGSQPLHTTKQYNGWTGPNPNGYTTAHKIHEQFETIYLSANIKPADVAPLVVSTKPVLIDNEWSQYLAYLRHTNSLVEKTYQLEKAGGFTNAGTPEAKAFTEERLAAGAIELRDLITSAWVHSGDPIEEYHGPQ